MPLPYAHIVSGGPSSFAHPSPLPDEDEDELDDICPVCESECTCPKKSAPTPASTATEPSASSTPSSAPSSGRNQPLQWHPSHGGKNPLKIKLTLSKARKAAVANSTRTSAHLGPDPGPSTARAGKSITAAVPKRRGRPPKALAAKYNAKKKAAADDMEYKARGTTATAHTVRKPYQLPAPAAGADLSDSTLSDYPTFVPAASESTHSSSSESSDSEITSESDDDDEQPETMYQARTDDGMRQSTKLLPSHVGQTQRRRDRGSGNKWEVRPRKKSVGAGDDDDEESSAESGDSSADSSEDGDDENDEEDEAEADVEPEPEVEEGGVLALTEVDMDPDDDDDERRSCIGITFPGNGWSDDEESFDADLFFANLDGSSDSGASSPEEHYAELRNFTSDTVISGSFSADEEDALLLMDLDPSVQLRRSDDAFEIGVELDNLFGWDGGLLFTNSDLPDSLDLSFDMGAPDEDTDMYSASGSDVTDSDGSDSGSGTGTVVLQESDGDTTEDELVDSDGLPNPRAMMLFRWPSTVSAINPLSTVNPFASPPPDASPSTRIALASISTQRRSPPPTPADILAGKISMDDLEDIEMDKERFSPVRRRRGVPIMGEFATQGVNMPKQAAVVDGGREVPSFYPRPVRVIKPEPEQQQEAPVESQDAFMSSLRPPLPTESSDEVTQSMSQQSYTSDLSSTEVIELDDVLDSSMLDSEPSAQDCETDVPDPQSQSSPLKGSHIQSLSRWDRIPMATFRRTRETATASGVDGAVSDTGLGALPFRGIGTLMGGGLPLFAPPLDKMSRASARKRKSRHSHSHHPSPTLSARDGMLGSPFAPAPGGSGSGSGQFPPGQGQQNKSKKEMKKEKAMMKRKLVAKSSQYRYQQPHRAHHHHHHLPNHKSRATGSVQRASFAGAGSSIPSLTI
ncbi:hypothetical protein BD413DRAFT_616090 [Trametes elegans]|nr:hypothetical protein BD413DRAFT_616090 [Trametes elegans]